MTRSGAPYRAVAGRGVSAAWVATSVVLALAVTTQLAAAQPQSETTGAALAREVAALRAEIDGLRQAASQVDTIAASLTELDERLSVLAQQLEVLERQREAVPDAFAALDDVAARVRALEVELVRVRGAIADVARPGGGGGVEYDEGFALATADGRFAVRFNGFVQPRVTVDAPEQAGSTELDTASASLRRARVGWRGHLGSDRLRFKVQLALLSSPVALDYYLDYRVAPWLRLRAGQLKVPGLRSFAARSRALVFVERPDAVDQHRYDRDLGAYAHGKLADNRVRYFVGLSNGAGRNRVNDNIDFAVFGRVEGTPVGERVAYGEGDVGHTEQLGITVGAGAVHDLIALPAQLAGLALQTDVDGDGDTDNVRAISIHADAALRYRGVSAEAAVMFRRESWGAIIDHPDNAALSALLNDDSDRNYVGWYGQATYAPVRDLLVVGARVGRTRQTFLRPTGLTQVDATPAASRRLEVSGVAQLYADSFGGRALGLQYQYLLDSNVDQPDPIDNVEHRIILEAQVAY